MSAQRFEQNGLNACSAALPQIGQRAGEDLRSISFMPAPAFLASMTRNSVFKILP